MERCNADVIVINATCPVRSLGMQLMGMHTLTGCDTASYPFNKGKLGSLKVLQARNFPGLYEILVEVNATKDGLVNRPALLHQCVVSHQVPR